MSVLKEVLDGIEEVSKAIKNTGSIIDAVKDGQGYLTKRYKDAKSDVCQILEEMNKTLITTSSATSIITHFSFVDDPQSYAKDLREFNNRIMDGKAEIDGLLSDIDKYRGHCSKIKRHVERITSGNKLDSLFRVFGVDSQKRNQELGKKLQEIYDEEHQHYVTVYALCENLKKAIDHVHETLGGPGLVQRAKIPEAVTLLQEYGNAFKGIESAANRSVFQLRGLIVALS
jgi:triacylglycerol esterase/lipase EstA (alpha/beta hydrolase family)